jgi:hypothetical protein
MDFHDVSLVALRVLRELAERGTLTAAAVALGYAQSVPARSRPAGSTAASLPRIWPAMLPLDSPQFGAAGVGEGVHGAFRLLAVAVGFLLGDEAGLGRLTRNARRSGLSRTFLSSVRDSSVPDQ